MAEIANNTRVYNEERFSKILREFELNNIDRRSKN